MLPEGGCGCAAKQHRQPWDKHQGNADRSTLFPLLLNTHANTHSCSSAAALRAPTSLCPPLDAPRCLSACGYRASLLRLPPAISTLRLGKVA